MVSPIVDRLRIIPRGKEFLDRATGSSGEVFFSKETNTLRIYSGRTANRGGFEVITDASLRRIAAEEEISSVKYSVTVNNSGAGTKFVLNGIENPSLTFIVGYTYIFDQSNATNVFYPNPTGGENNQHPFSFSSDNLNGEAGDGTTYNTGVKYILNGEEVSRTRYIDDFQKSSIRVVQITVTTQTVSTLYYWGPKNLNMGNVISVGMPARLLTNSPFRLPNLTETQRNNLTPQNGDLIYNMTSNKIEAFQNGTWIELDTGSLA